MEQTTQKLEKATFAAGCFWGVQSIFDQVEGVTQTIVGYTGGHTANPTYREVCSDTTGHAESIEILFNPDIVSYQQLLDVLWKNHDPTTLNKQGPDVGSQYRSAIFYHSQEQQKVAQQSKEIQEKSGEFSSPIVTEITAATEFYPAEEYHQKYFQKQGIEQTCHR